MKLRNAMLLGLAAVALVLPDTAHAEFGFVPGSVSAVAANSDGTLDSEAGSHPSSYTVNFRLNVTASSQVEGGAARDIIANLPTGFIGNPQAVAACPRQEFEGVLPKCSTETQVGVLRATIPGLGETRLPIFNLAPPPGVVAALGGGAVNLNVLQDASVRTEEGYGVSVGAFNVPSDVSAVTETIWGVPAESEHDAERGGETLEGQAPPVPSNAPRLPYLTMPTSCGGPLEITVKADSTLNPGVFAEQTALMLDAGGQPAALTGCERVPFTPSIKASPTSESAEASSGINFELTLPNAGLLDPDGIAETEPEKTEVTLPEGFTVNPSAANGIVGCTLAQYREATGEVGQGCPEASKVGTLRAKSPLLTEAIEGSVYLASPRANPFGSLLALYIVARAPVRGVLVKQAGEVQADQQTGRLTTTFDQLPPLPYSSFEFKLREGPRAPLITPRTCGEYMTTARLYPFSDPGTATAKTAPFKIASGAAGGPCVPAESQAPNRPGFEAGTVTPVAGSFAPFVFKVSRADGDQRFSSLQATLPVGLLGKLKGVPYCPESGIATASSRGQEGGGAEELASPSCPSASQVGIANVSAGAGPQPYYVQGKVYLAGPYKGAPLSLEVITPAIAGPFDFGSVAVRTALTVDPFTAQIHAQSDPLPTILHGIPLDVRSISLQMNKPEFTLNPTDCSAKSVTGALTTLTGQSAALSSPFAVAGCAGLKFAPQLKISLKGSTGRGGHPALRAEVTYPKGSGYANIARAQVSLPHAEFLDQGNLNLVCKQAELRAGTCPDATIYGRVKAWTPLLEQPLEGNVYLGVGFGYKLPALVAELGGQIRVLLVGKIDTGKNKGIRNTFEAVPDAPVEKFVLSMKGGKKYGLLENSENICGKGQQAEVAFKAQNGDATNSKVAIKTSCRKKKAGRKK
jgi:hypothetical protein